jgi:cystathionine gamma-synthase
MKNSNTAPGTQCIWAGEEDYLMQGATQVPVVHSVSFGYKDMDEWLAVALGEKSGHIYGRNTNPTVHAFEEKVRQLEGAEAATSASTGMGIISSTLFALLSPGIALSPSKTPTVAPTKSSLNFCHDFKSK